MEDLLTIGGIIICLIVIIYLAILFFKNTKEGLTNPFANTIGSTGPDVPATTTTVTTSPSLVVPSDIAKNIQVEADKLHNLLSISTNKSDYEDIILNLNEYYNDLTLFTIINAKKTNDGYNLNKIAQYKIIQDALNKSYDYLDTAR
jgi:hypothetical protein